MMVLEEQAGNFAARSSDFETAIVSMNESGSISQPQSFGSFSTHRIVFDEAKALNYLSSYVGREILESVIAEPESISASIEETVSSFF